MGRAGVCTGPPHHVPQRPSRWLRLPFSAESPDRFSLSDSSAIKRAGYPVHLVASANLLFLWIPSFLCRLRGRTRTVLSEMQGVSPVADEVYPRSPAAPRRFLGRKARRSGLGGPTEVRNDSSGERTCSGASFCAFDRMTTVAVLHLRMAASACVLGARCWWGWARAWWKPVPQECPS